MTLHPVPLRYVREIFINFFNSQCIKIGEKPSSEPARAMVTAAVEAGSDAVLWHSGEGSFQEADSGKDGELLGAGQLHHHCKVLKNRPHSTMQFRSCINSSMKHLLQSGKSDWSCGCWRWCACSGWSWAWGSRPSCPHQGSIQVLPAGERCSWWSLLHSSSRKVQAVFFIKKLSNLWWKHLLCKTW